MDYYGYNEFDSFFATIGVLSLVIGILILALVVVGIVANWKLFKKAGKNGWECIIPFYSYWVLIEISGLNWWWFLLIIFDIVLKIESDGLSLAFNICSFLASFNCYYNIAKKFNKSNGTSVCAGIFSFIFILIFGFSKNEVYDANIPVSPNGIFGATEKKFDNENTNNSYQTNIANQSTTSVDTIEDNETEKKSNNEKTNVQEHSFCGNCGTKLEKDARFCPNCGKEKI